MLKHFWALLSALCHFVMPSLWDTGMVPGVNPQGTLGPVGPVGKIDV